MKKVYDHILFDLDGTLTDPGIGITNSVMHALKQYDIEVTDRSKLYRFIGPPLADSFARYYGFGKEQCLEAIGYYREYYAPHGIFENEVYAGIPEVLAELKARGKKVLLATSKPEEFAVKILQHFALDSYFDCVAGATMDEKIVTKVEIMEMALHRMQITDVSRALMIGDREYDISGAKHFGMDSVGVTYGYGSRRELEEAGATYLAEKPRDLLDLIDPSEQ